ncbi:hypothetical protein D3C87_1096770 [compost metagenome]
MVAPLSNLISPSLPNEKALPRSSKFAVALNCAADNRLVGVFSTRGRVNALGGV